MGRYFADQYSLLHFAVGIVMYFWKVPLGVWIILHSVFEMVENSKVGMKFINSAFKDLWPGGKPKSDSLVNSVGDVVFGTLGWIVAQKIDHMGVNYGWYSPHLKT